MFGPFADNMTEPSLPSEQLNPDLACRTKIGNIDPAFSELPGCAPGLRQREGGKLQV